MSLPGGLSSGLITSVGISAAGFAGVNVLLDKLSTPGASGRTIIPASLATGVPRIATKAALALAASLVIKKVAKAPAIARGILIGGLMSCALDLLSVATTQVAPRGVRGMDDWDQLNGADDMRGLPDSMNGLGAIGRGDVQMPVDYAAQ